MILLTGRLEIISNWEHDRVGLRVEGIEVRNLFCLIALDYFGRPCEESIGLSR